MTLPTEAYPPDELASLEQTVKSIQANFDTAEASHTTHDLGDVVAAAVHILEVGENDNIEDLPWLQDKEYSYDELHKILFDIRSRLNIKYMQIKQDIEDRVRRHSAASNWGAKDQEVYIHAHTLTREKTVYTARKYINMNASDVVVATQIHKTLDIVVLEAANAIASSMSVKSARDYINNNTSGPNIAVEMQKALDVQVLVSAMEILNTRPVFSARAYISSDASDISIAKEMQKALDVQVLALAYTIASVRSIDEACEYIDLNASNEDIAKYMKSTFGSRQ